MAPEVTHDWAEWASQLNQQRPLDCCELLLVPTFEQCDKPAIGYYELACDVGHRRRKLLCRDCLVENVMPHSCICITCEKVGHMSPLYVVACLKKLR